MKRLFICIMLPLFLLSCARAKEEVLLSPLTADEISGERLWERITAEADYLSYGGFPGHDGMRPGQSPHGVWHIVYANKPLRGALPLADKIAPVGTIIVKENFTPSKELDALTVMAKVDGYNPETGDWFWAMYSPEGEVRAEGMPGGCLSCHSGKADNDYVIIKNLDEALNE